MYFLLFFFFQQKTFSTLKPILTLAPIPDTILQLMQLPFDFEMDRRGRFYVVDAMAQTLFVWEKDGRFLQTIGKGGEGPGEFSFMGPRSGGPQAYISSLGDQLYVFDGPKRTISLFNSDYQFVKSTPLVLPAGRIESFDITNNGEVLVFLKSFLKPEPQFELKIFDLNGKELRTILAVDDHTFSRNMREGKLAGIVYHGFAPTLCVNYDNKTDKLIAGYSDKPGFEVYNTSGKRLETIKISIKTPSIKEEDKKEYLEQTWIKKSSFLSADFSDYMSYYDEIYSLGNRGFLVFHQSPFYFQIQGVWTNLHGETLSTFRFRCGEGGGLFNARNRLLAIQLNEDGDFILQEVTISED